MTKEELQKVKRGQKVKVFNQVGDDWIGTVTHVNRSTARVKADGKMTIFTNHNDSRTADNEREFLVPFCDLTLITPTTPQ